MAREAAGMRSAKKKKPTLVIIFNNPHIENVPKLAKFYGKRFSRIFYILPCLEGSEWRQKYKAYNIIPLHYRAELFQFAMANGFEQYRHWNTSHYIFAQDDCLINPLVNEDNYQSFFKISAGQSYTNDYGELESCYSLLPWRSDNFATHQMPSHLLNNKPSFRRVLQNCYITFRRNLAGGPDALDFRLRNDRYISPPKCLPDRKEAIRIFKKHGLHTENIAQQGVTRPLFRSYRYSPAVWGPSQPPRRSSSWLLRVCSFHKHFYYWRICNSRYFGLLYKICIIPAIINYLITGKDDYRPGKFDYPLVGGYSDIILVPHAAIENFISFLGYFANADLTEWLCIPTSLVLSQRSIRVRKDLQCESFSPGYTHNNPFVGEHAKNGVLSKNLDDIAKNWPKDFLYIHPIKLSEVE